MTDIKQIAEGQQCEPAYHEGFYHGQSDQFDLDRNYDEDYCAGWRAADSVRTYLLEKENG